MTRSTLALLLAVACSLLSLAGCASMNASNQESLLSAAGFRSRTPGTPKQLELYAAIPPYKVQRATVNGRVFYVYKDEKQGLAYIGGEREYQRYQQLAIQQSIAREYYVAAEMNNASAWGWYGAWGPGPLFW